VIVSSHAPTVGATVLTDRFDRALLYATHVHGGQVRKGTSTPYVAHFDERVMRMGFGDLAAIKTLRDAGIEVNSTPGLRTGLVIVDPP
jgi:predicted MPP superfamily phosphohydrolase